jgi:mannonate dehydratase
MRNVGKAGIPVFGYNFSVAGVWGRIQQQVARGGALTHSYIQKDAYVNNLIPIGHIWNVIYDKAARGVRGTGDGEQKRTKNRWDRTSYSHGEMRSRSKQIEDMKRSCSFICFLL